MSDFDANVRVIRLDDSRAHRRGGLMFWVPRALIIVPLVTWLLIVITWGLRAPIFFLLFGALLFPLLMLPMLIAAIGGQRNVIRAMQIDRSIRFPATSSDRYVYWGTAALLLGMVPVVLWDWSRVGEQLSIVGKMFLGIFIVCAGAGLFSIPRLKPAYLSLDDYGIETRIRNHVHRLDWSQVPPLGPSGWRDTRVMNGLGIPNPAYLLRSDPEIVMDMVEFYRANPTLRHEIGTGKALDRLERGDLPRRGARQPTAPVDQ